MRQRTEMMQSLLKPYPAERMRAYSISTRVNSVKNDDAGLIEPMMATGGIAVWTEKAGSHGKGNRWEVVAVLSTTFEMRVAFAPSVNLLALGTGHLVESDGAVLPTPRVSGESSGDDATRYRTSDHHRKHLGVFIQRHGYSIHHGWSILVLIDFSNHILQSQSWLYLCEWLGS
jgi:hypothetical protein